MGTIFLDRELRIRKFTPQIAETLQPGAARRGAAHRDLHQQLDHPELVDDLQRVLATGAAASSASCATVAGKAFFLRILPYRAKGTIDGVVLTLIDVSGLKAAEDALFHERYLLNSLLATVPDAIYFKDARGRFIRANDAMADAARARDPASRWARPRSSCRSTSAALELHRQDEAVLRTGEASTTSSRSATGRDGSGASGTW